jgi:hypothetical protein
MYVFCCAALVIRLAGGSSAAIAANASAAAASVDPVSRADHVMAGYVTGSRISMYETRFKMRWTWGQADIARHIMGCRQTK